MSSYELGVYFNELIHGQRLSITEVAKRASLSRESVYKIIRGEVCEPNLSTIVRLSRVLNIHPIIPLRKLFDGLDLGASQQPVAKKALDGIGFIADVTYPDNDLVSVNQRFVKRWEIQNTGRITWIDRKLVCVDDLLEVHSASSDLTVSIPRRGLLPSDTEIDIGRVEPGARVKLGVEFTAPSYPCTVISYWKMVDSTGNFCYPKHEGLSCLVRVITF
ncbi:MAG: NBR1-Ig-like domain-containing protein [bacterium]